MTRRILSLLTAALFLLLPLACAAAEGDYYYDEPHYGIVICRQMKVRNNASTSGKEYGQIKNSQPVKIVGEHVNRNNVTDFYLLDLQSCGFKADPGTFGYAKSSLIKMDPEYFYASGMLDLYATPWGDGKKNGEQGKRFFLILSGNGSWYAVQTLESSPGTSFINTRNVSVYYQSRYVVTWDAPLYDDYGTQIKTAKRGEFGYMENQSADSTLLVFNRGEADKEFRAWIPTLYVAPCVN